MEFKQLYQIMKTPMFKCKDHISKIKLLKYLNEHRQVHIQIFYKNTTL